MCALGNEVVHDLLPNGLIEEGKIKKSIKTACKLH
jgi:hypothetical protein